MSVYDPFANLLSEGIQVVSGFVQNLDPKP